MVRDMITTTSEDFGPAQLEQATETLASMHEASTTSIVDEELLEKGYAQVHTVGGAASAERQPPLVHLVWNQNGASENGALPKFVFVGKGVCYDIRGLSLKPTSGMITIKKDMGGAAHVLGLAHMIIDAELRVELHVLVPAVENSVSSNSFRPGDVLMARNGKATLNSNSDAEGQLILADALVAGSELDPDVMIDCATLTGAQRVAMGPDIPSFFSTDDEFGMRLWEASKQEGDLMWPLPLHEPYRKMLDCAVADVQSCGSEGLARCIVAAPCLIASGY